MNNRDKSDFFQRQSQKIEQGKQLFIQKNFEDALKIFNDIYDSIPLKLKQEKNTLWILGYLGDCSFFLGNYSKALNYFQKALTCDQGDKNPYFFIRCAECQWELKNYPEAVPLFEIGLRLGGKPILDKEEEKYRFFVKNTIAFEPPPQVLSPQLTEEINHLISQGNSFFERAIYTRALRFFQDAMDLIPEPKTRWEVFFWLETRIAETLFQNRDFKKADAYFVRFLKNQESEKNPFIQLRHAVCLFELDNKNDALSIFKSVYVATGDTLFQMIDSVYINSLFQNDPALRNITPGNNSPGNISSKE